MGQEILIGTAPLVPLIAIGMLLTAAGIYGVLAFAITRRSRELAVRIAVGATGRDLVRLVTAHTLRLVGVGAAGIAVTFGLSRIVRARRRGQPLRPGGQVFVIPVLPFSSSARWRRGSPPDARSNQPGRAAAHDLSHGGH